MKLTVVIPVYQSAQSLPILVPDLVIALREAGPFEIIAVDDASKDGSWKVLCELQERFPTHIKAVRLLQNRGQHNAILCGFAMASGEVIVTMDDDLQHPPHEVPRLAAALGPDYDLVIGDYGMKQHFLARNLSGALIDRLLRHIFGLPHSIQLTSFRAIRRHVVEQVNQMSVPFPYVTAMLLSQTGRVGNIRVQHDRRKFGRSNYGIRQSTRLALNLVLNYSTLPIYFVAGLCALAFTACLAVGTLVTARALWHESSVQGWASTIVVITFFNALILLALVIMGLYLSRLSRQLSRTRTTFTVGEVRG